MESLWYNIKEIVYDCTLRVPILKKLNLSCKIKEELLMDAKEFKIAEGSCIISEDVIASIAATAALETDGIAAMANHPANLRGIISQNVAQRSVRVLNTEDDTVVDVYVIIKEGARIQETAVALQQNVKMAIQSMTGKPVTRVNVHIQGVAAAITEVVEDN